MMSASAPLSQPFMQTTLSGNHAFEQVSTILYRFLQSQMPDVRMCIQAFEDAAPDDDVRKLCETVSGTLFVVFECGDAMRGVGSYELYNDMQRVVADACNDVQGDFCRLQINVSYLLAPPADFEAFCTHHTRWVALLCTHEQTFQACRQARKAAATMKRSLESEKQVSKQSKPQDIHPLSKALTLNNIVVIGLSGKIGAGKTTLANALVQHYGAERCVLRNFADALKEQVSSHYGFPLEWCYSQDGKERVIAQCGGKTVGQILQDWGTALRTEVDAEVWVEAVATWLRAQRASSQFLVVLLGDVRFPNEHEFLRNVCGGRFVRLDGDPGGVRAASTRNLTHISETALDDAARFVRDLQFCTDNVGVDEMVQHCVALVDAELERGQVTKRVLAGQQLQQLVVPLLVEVRRMRKEMQPSDAEDWCSGIVRSSPFRSVFDDPPKTFFSAEQWYRLRQFCVTWCCDCFQDSNTRLPSLQALIDAATTTD